MKSLASFLIFAGMLLSLGSSAIGQKMKAEDIVAKHLESIGTADARAKAGSRIAVGEASARFLSTRDQVVQGRIVLASEGTRNFIGLNMNSTRYPGERFVFDGNDVSVAAVQDNSRSLLGNFVQSNGMLLRESLLGGSLASSWVVGDMAGKGKMSLEGTKKIDGRETYAIGYSRKGGGDVDVTMYFDKETFQHVRTEYKRTSSAGIGNRPEDSTRFNESRLRVVEEFSDHRPEGGLVLPHEYKILYSISGQNGTTEIEWVFKLTEFAFNQKLDPATFKVQ